jgi:Protein of unknown function (DUF1638)
MSAVAGSRRRLLISCDVFRKEVEESRARCECPLDVQYLPFGLHGESALNARDKIQAAVDAADSSVYDVVLLAYGLCNYGIRGLRARRLPLVLPRAHDCLSLLFGDRRRYREFFQEQPDTYYFTSGWVENRGKGDDLHAIRRSMQSYLRINNDLQELINKYGEDNGRYIYEQLSPRQYSQYVYISTRCKDEELLIEQAADIAERAGCELRIIEGDTRLIDQLLQGPWDPAHFLVMPPGKEVALAYDERLIEIADIDHES